ncbi:MAG: hypothetical protein H8E21_04995 [Gammaproteobacteria bacterium]|nr:hypothetical protein [Gammaproteobacteria bacterium]
MTEGDAKEDIQGVLRNLSEDEKSCYQEVSSDLLDVYDGDFNREYKTTVFAVFKFGNDTGVRVFHNEERARVLSSTKDSCMSIRLFPYRCQKYHASLGMLGYVSPERMASKIISKIWYI